MFKTGLRLLKRVSFRPLGIQNLTPQYTIFDFFKKKSKDPKLSENKRELEEDDEMDPREMAEEEEKFENKEKYAKKLAQQRLEWEAAREAAKKEAEFIDQRKKREYEVQFNQMDFARLSVQNINITPVSEFQHVEELFFFISNLRVKLSEENIKKVVDGFLKLAEKLSEKDLDSAYFKEFVDVLENNIAVLSDVELLTKTVKFADLYCVESRKFWENLEKKIMAKASGLPLTSLTQCLFHFSQQNEGSDHFYDRLEAIIQAKVPQGLDYQLIVSIVQSYFKVKRGTPEFIEDLLKVLAKRIDEGFDEDLVKVAQIIKAAKGEHSDLFKRIETKILPGVNKLEFAAVCALGDGFGFENGTAEFWKMLEETIRAKPLEEYSFEEIRLIFKGFLYSYRGSKTLFEDLSSKILDFKDSLSILECATIAKAYYIVEVDNNELSSNMIRRITYELKNSVVSLEDIMEIVKTFTLTRTGTRELYKLLEVIIRQRLEELKDNPEILKGIYTYYLTSGLCSPELLQRIETIL